MYVEININCLVRLHISGYFTGYAIPSIINFSLKFYKILLIVSKLKMTPLQGKVYKKSIFILLIFLKSHFFIHSTCGIKNHIILHTWCATAFIHIVLSSHRWTWKGHPHLKHTCRYNVPPFFSFCIFLTVTIKPLFAAAKGFAVLMRRDALYDPIPLYIRSRGNSMDAWVCLHVKRWALALRN